MWDSDAIQGLASRFASDLFEIHLYFRALAVRSVTPPKLASRIRVGEMLFRDCL